MSEINGTQNNSLRNMLESLDASFSNNKPTNTTNTSNGSLREIFKGLESETMKNGSLQEMFKQLGLTGTNPTSPTNSTVDTKPAVQPAPPKKKKKKGFFSKIGGFFKKVGGFLKKALPIISTIAMFIPGIGTAIGGALKIATAAMGAFDAIKNKNPLGFLSSVAGAFTGGATNMLGKLGSVGSYIQKGVDMFKNSGVGSLVTKGFDLFNKGKEWLSNTTAGLGGKVTNWLTSNGSKLFNNLTSGIGGKVGDFLKSNGADWIKKLAGNAGSSVTNWLNDKATSLFDKVTNSPFVQKARSFFDSGIGKTLLDLFTKKTA